jgi:hypothetical protein
MPHFLLREAVPFNQVLITSLHPHNHQLTGQSTTICIVSQSQVQNLDNFSTFQIFNLNVLINLQYHT